jgi:signal transduction histidine kinase
MNKFSIRTKLVLLVFLVLIPVVIISMVRIESGYQKCIEAEFKASQDFAEVFSTAFMSYIDHIWSDQYIMGLTISTNTNWTQKDVEGYMNNVLKTNEDLLGYSWANLDGTVWASTKKQMVGKSIRNKKYYAQLMNGEEKVLSDLIQRKNNKEVTVLVARCIKVNNKPIGLFISTINVNKLDKIFTMKRIGRTSSFGLVDRNGLVVYRSGSKEISLEKRKVKLESSAWKALKGEIIRVTTYKGNIDNSNKMGIYYPIVKVKWACFVSTSVNELLGKYKRDMTRDIVLLFMVAICSLLFVVMLGGRLINSIEMLREAAQEVAKGNFTYKTNFKGSDELAITCQAFDKMTEQINTKLTEVEEYSNLKSQFFSTISHELKTPLNVIYASTQLMEKLDNCDTDAYFNKTQKHINVLKQNSLRLIRLITNLIDVNKIGVNQLIISPQNLDIVHVVEDITLSIVEYTRLKNIELIFDTEIEEMIIAFDPDMIERVMLNLLSNAIKFTEPGGSIYVNIYTKQETVAISVKDTGMGIPVEMQQKIFDCFAQVDSSLHRNAEGSGIGLSLVKSIVELHGGSIRLISDMGCGSEFIMEFPNSVNENIDIVQSDINIAKVERIHVEFSDIYF